MNSSAFSSRTSSISSRIASTSSLSFSWRSLTSSAASGLVSSLSSERRVVCRWPPVSFVAIRSLRGPGGPAASTVSSPPRSPPNPGAGHGSVTGTCHIGAKNPHATDDANPHQRQQDAPERPPEQATRRPQDGRHPTQAMDHRPHQSAYRTCDANPHQRPQDAPERPGTGDTNPSQ